jgi:TonB family protein
MKKMLNQLIESKNHATENTRRSSFLAGTLGVLVAVLVSGWTYSLFAKNFGMGTGEFELSSILAPVTAVDDAPPPKPPVPIQKSTAPASNQIILKDLYSDIDSSRIPPKDTSGVKDVVSAQQFDLDKVRLGKINQIPQETGGRDVSSDDSGCGLCPSGTGDNPDKEVEKTPEVVVKPSPKPSEQKKPPVQSLGVINGKATYLAKPIYPAVAKAMRAEGAVNVQVLIDEKGNVVSASVVSGHPLLRAVAEQAAKQSRFSPTYLSNQPVKVTGVIVYQFKAN